MGRYRKVNPAIWDDASFTELSKNGKLLYLFLLTHPNMTSLGAMKATLPGLSAELRWPFEIFKRAFRQVVSYGLTELDKHARFLWLPRAHLDNKPESPNVARHWGAILKELPDCHTKGRCIEEIERYLESLPQSFVKEFRQALWESPTQSVGEADPLSSPLGMPNQGTRNKEQGTRNKDQGTPRPAGNAVPQIQVQKSSASKEPEPARHNRFLNVSVEAKVLAELLLDRIRQNKPDFKQPDMEAWEAEMERMLGIDKREPARVRQVIAWCQADNIPDSKGFCWAHNILSPSKLRKQFDQLELRMAAPRSAGQESEDKWASFIQG